MGRKERAAKGAAGRIKKIEQSFYDHGQHEPSNLKDEHSQDVAAVN
jgi:hypothetical protein